MIIDIIITIFLFWLFYYIILPIVIAIIKFKFLINFDKHIKLIQTSGKWAVVTGSTDGIGREYCRQLAKLGLNIFLISRDEIKLESTRKELKQYNRIDVRYFKADFKSNVFYGELNQALKDLDIGVLVNNVGMTQGYPENFDEVDQDLLFLSDIINCNILSAISLTKIVAPGMRNRRRGVIINISSASSIMPMPLVALYSSSKSFITHFSRSINAELSCSGVIVQTVRPFYVQTKFIGKFRPMRILTPTAEEYVESAIKTIALENETFGTLSHSIQGAICCSLPNWMMIPFTRLINRSRQFALLKDS